MAITSRKITTYAKNIVDLSDQPNKDGLTTPQLKAFFDGRTDQEVKTSINGIIDDLVATTDGASGADQIGATPLTGGTGNTVQEVLEEIDGSTVHNAGDETVAGVKTFSSSPIVPTPTTDMQASTKKYVDDLDALNVHLAGVETITGVKTFSVSPIVPAPTTDTQASTKKYVDDTDGARKTYVDNLDALAAHLAGNETITGIKTFSASPVVPAPTTDTQAATKKYVDDADALKVDITDIVNDLTTGGTAVPLSAEQGKTLQGEVGTLASLSTTEKGSLVGAINEVDDHADTNATSIGTLASLTTTEKTNLVGAINELDTDKVETSAITNTLTETAEGKVLDARQGKALSDRIGNQTFTEKNYVTDGASDTANIDALDMAVKDNADLISTNLAEYNAFVGLPATNLVTNGDFSNGTTGWTSFGNFSIVDATAKTIVNGHIGYQTITALTAAHKYYISARNKLMTGSVSSGTNSSTGARLSTSTGSTKVTLTISTVNGAGTLVSGALDTWVRSSVVYTADGTEARFYLRYGGDEFSTIETYYDNALLIDLTETFGSGYEPTASEMDMILTIGYANGWFDGTVASLMNHKQLAQFTLGQIRAIKLAIVANGGTI